MRRRDFMTGTAAAGLAAALPLPALSRGLAEWCLASADPDAAALLARRLAAATEGRLRLVPVPAGSPAESALVPAWTLSPAMAVLAAMPFGPGPEHLAAWLAAPDGAALFREAAGDRAWPALVRPGAAVVADAAPQSLRDLSSTRVAAAGPLGELWHRLGARVTGDGDADIRDGATVVAGAARGFGPCGLLSVLTVSPAALAGLPAPLRRALELPPLVQAGPLPASALAPEIMVAAGNRLWALRAELKDAPDPLSARIARLLPPPAEAAAPAACWPWMPAARVA